MPKLKSPDPLPSGFDLLSYEEAARFLGPSITPRWVRQRVAEGSLPALRLTQRCTRIERRALEEFVEAERQQAGVA